MARFKSCRTGRASGWAFLALGLLASAVHAQRQMEPLGRGVVALRSATTQAYIGWRLLATDPENIGFNLYRSVNGAAGVKVNTGVLTNTTDFVDTGASFTSSNAWYVRPVSNGVEQSPSASAGLAANAPVRQYLSVPLKPVVGGWSPPYDVKFCWVGDFDGDGEYDFLVDRLTTTATNKANQYLQAYKRDGTLLWQMDMGFNSTNIANTYEPDAAAISVGDKDNVTVYDLDGDGRAEVIVRTANGTTFANGSQIVTNNNTVQFLSILDGLTGGEKARAPIPNPYFADGPLNCHAGVLYLDGIRPSVILSGENRVGGGEFQRLTVAWNYRDGQLSQRWLYVTPPGENDSEGHQLRVADVNHDGRDDLIRIGGVIGDSNGVPITLYSTELVHGDRYHVTDIDPDRAGLEMYAIQQNNATLLGTALEDLRSGQLYKKWYAGTLTDVGRGLAVDLDPNYRGVELYSTMDRIYDCRGAEIVAFAPWPWEGIWWNADLNRELFAARDGNGLRPCINRWNYAANSEDLVYNVQTEGVHSAYGARPAFFGDLLGDWREEFIVVADDYSAIRIYTTKNPASNRFYCLMQNPQYRGQCTFKGYYQASYVDYYLGVDMPPVPVPPVSDAQLVWRGHAGNFWDEHVTPSWFTNNLWVSNTTATTFTSGSTVLFDATGSNGLDIVITGALTPGEVRVHSPKPYTFSSLAGGLTGAMKLTKAGAGPLTLVGTNTFIGATLIGEGPLLVNGSLPNSPVTVRGGVWLDGRLGGAGVVGSPVLIQEGGGLAPGAAVNLPGKLTLASSLTLGGRTRNEFDLADDPTGKTNDLVQVNGNLVINGTNTFVFHLLDATLPPGSVYPLVNFTGTLTGNLNNLRAEGLDGYPYAFTNPPGQIALVIKSLRPPATLTWTGGFNGNTWDLVNTSNWLNGLSRDSFYPNDTVRFNAVGTSNLTVNLSGTLIANQVIVDSPANYTLSGAGAIIGPGSLLKSNTGTLTISGLDHAFAGRTIIAGGTLAVAELDGVGYPSSLGRPSNHSPTNLLITGSATLRLLGECYTDRGITISGGTNSIDVPDATDQFTLLAPLTGVSAFRKLGAGTLAFSAGNTFSGTTIIQGGTIALGGDAANISGFGTGTPTIILDGGGITMFIDNNTTQTSTWNVQVPTTGFINLDWRGVLAGSGSGAGTLTMWTPYVRADISGNWTTFTGQLNLTTDVNAKTATDRGGDFRIANAAGFPNARINLQRLVSLQNRVGAGALINLGELSGEIGCNAAAPGGNSGLTGTFSVGALNTSATFGGNTYNGLGFTKVGTGTWTWTGTNLAHTGATVVNGGTLTVNGNAVQASGAVTVGASGTLAGNGILGGLVTVNGAVSPGVSGIGLLTCTNHVTLSANSVTRTEIRKSPKTNDLLRTMRTLTYGGLLTVTNLAGTLAVGDSFKLFDAATYAGGFSAFNLPSLPKGLTWSKPALLTSGTITVVTNPPPRLTNAWTSGTSLTLRGTGGGPFLDYWLLNSTNAALPVSQWSRVLTNQFDATGSFNLSIPIQRATPPQFYQLQVP